MYRGGGGLTNGSPHNTVPLEVRIPECGHRHVIADLPDLSKLDPADAAVIRGNFHQLATKVNHLMAALRAMDIPV